MNQNQKRKELQTTLSRVVALNKGHEVESTIEKMIFLDAGLYEFRGISDSRIGGKMAEKAYWCLVEAGLDRGFVGRSLNRMLHGGFELYANRSEMRR